MIEISRRNLLKAGTVAGLAGVATSATAASYGNPDRPPQGG